MREIGGYLSFEKNDGPVFHEDAIPLNSGRSALAYLIHCKGIRKIAIPYYMCDSVFDICKKNNVEIRYYHVNFNFRPDDVKLNEDEWLYLMNYYGQLTENDISEYKQKFERVILDNTQAYYEKPMSGLDAIYSCRKYFGVPDGAFLYTNERIDQPLERDYSYDRMEHLLGSFEKTASEFYSLSQDNNRRFREEPVKLMSKLTENIIRGIDYEKVRLKRNRNYNILHDALQDMNELNVRSIEGAFSYPFMIKNGSVLKKRLIDNKIYIPTLWPNVLETAKEDWPEYYMVKDLLPVPCDQRYSDNDMEYILDMIKAFINTINN